MAGLTIKQENFCLAFVETGNASEAYRRAYPASLKWKDQPVHVNASKMMSNAEVSLRIAALRQALAAKTETDAEWVRRRLKEEADSFGEDASHSARVRALEILAKLNGMFELDNKQKTDPLREFLAALPGAVVGVVQNPSDDE
jgi:phage terminase small subunit